MTQKFTGVYSQSIEKKLPAWQNIRILNGLLVLVIIVGSLYYVTGINDLVVKGFRLQELKARVDNLAVENKKMTVAVASLKSYNNLAKRIENLGMVAVENIDYIKVENGVAIAK